jgi:two-component system chemotaxis response regulator CheY
MLALVVDDSRAMRAILTRYMTSLDFDVVQAGDGAEAMAVLDAGTRPDVILVDWNMPVMDGLTFIKQCRANPEYRNLVLMMVTTESEQSQIVRALAAGAHEYVIKPFTEDVIAEKLEILGLLSAGVVRA